LTSANSPFPRFRGGGWPSPPGAHLLFKKPLRPSPQLFHVFGKILLDPHPTSAPTRWISVLFVYLLFGLFRAHRVLPVFQAVSSSLPPALVFFFFIAHFIDCRAAFLVFRVFSGLASPPFQISAVFCYVLSYLFLRGVDAIAPAPLTWLSSSPSPPLLLILSSFCPHPLPTTIEFFSTTLFQNFLPTVHQKCFFFPVIVPPPFPGKDTPPKCDLMFSLRR